MEQHFVTKKRTFIVKNSVLVRVLNSDTKKSEPHPAIGERLVGGVDSLFSSEESDPPKQKQFLAFEYSKTGKKGRRIYSEAVIVSIEMKSSSVPPPAPSGRQRLLA